MKTLLLSVKGDFKQVIVENTRARNSFRDKGNDDIDRICDTLIVINNIHPEQKILGDTPISEWEIDEIWTEFITPKAIRAEANNFMFKNLKFYDSEENLNELNPYKTWAEFQAATRRVLSAFKINSSSLVSLSSLIAEVDIMSVVKDAAFVVDGQLVCYGDLAKLKIPVIVNFSMLEPMAAGCDALEYAKRVVYNPDMSVVSVQSRR